MAMYLRSHEVNDLRLGSKYNVIAHTIYAWYQGIWGYCMKPGTIDLASGWKGSSVSADPVKL